MDTLPEAKACRDIHPPSLEGQRGKAVRVSHRMAGGPQLYVQKRGHPMLRRRPFVAAIGPAERDGWLLCFERALGETIADATLRDTIWQSARQLAMHMQNKE